MEFTKEDRDEINKNLYNALRTITQQITRLNTESDVEGSIEAVLSNYDRGSTPTKYLSNQLTALSENVTVLQEFSNSSHIKIELDADTVETNDNQLEFANAINNNLIKLSETVSYWVDVLKNESDAANAQKIKKKISRINRRIFNITYDRNSSENDSRVNSPNFKNEFLTLKSQHITVMKQLVENVVLLNNNVSKLNRVYKKKFKRIQSNEAGVSDLPNLAETDKHSKNKHINSEDATHEKEKRKMNKHKEATESSSKNINSARTMDELLQLIQNRENVPIDLDNSNLSAKQKPKKRKQNDENDNDSVKKKKNRHEDSEMESMYDADSDTRKVRKKHETTGTDAEADLTVQEKNEKPHKKNKKEKKNKSDEDTQSDTTVRKHKDENVNDSVHKKKNTHEDSEIESIYDADSDTRKVRKKHRSTEAVNAEANLTVQEKNETHIEKPHKKKKKNKSDEDTQSETTIQKHHDDNDSVHKKKNRHEDSEIESICDADSDTRRVPKKHKNTETDAVNTEADLTVQEKNETHVERPHKKKKNKSDEDTQSETTPNNKPNRTENIQNSSLKIDSADEKSNKKPADKRKNTDSNTTINKSLASQHKTDSPESPLQKNKTKPIKKEILSDSADFEGDQEIPVLTDSFYNDPEVQNCTNQSLDGNPESDLFTEKYLDANDTTFDRQISNLKIKYLLEEAEEKSLIPDEVKEQLASLHVWHPWEIPLVHKIESRLGHSPTPEQKEALSQFQIKLGMFSKKEDEILKNNWKQFCKEHDFGEDPTYFLMLANGKECLIPYEERKKFVQYLAHGLEDRMLVSVYRRFKLLIKNYKKGRFTAMEDELIMDHYHLVQDGDAKFAPLVPILNRPITAIRNRCMVLLEKEQGLGDTTISWNLQLKEQFLKDLMRTLKITNVDDLRNVEISWNVWSQIGKEVGIPPMKLKLQWVRLYTQLFAKERISYKRLANKIVDILVEMGVEDWKLINWKDVASHFEGYSPKFLFFVLRHLIGKQIPPKYHKNLKKCIKFLRDGILESMSNSKNYMDLLQLTTSGNLIVRDQ